MLSTAQYANQGPCVDEYDRDHVPPDDRPLTTAAGPLFAWRDRTVVLLAERADNRWLLARGWLSGDRLLHVRRWSFPAAPALACQVRRLVREATDAPDQAGKASAALLAWAVEQVPAPLDPVQEPEADRARER